MVTKIYYKKKRFLSVIKKGSVKPSVKIFIQVLYPKDFNIIKHEILLKEIKRKKINK